VIPVIRFQSPQVKKMLCTLFVSLSLCSVMARCVPVIRQAHANVKFERRSYEIKSDEPSGQLKRRRSERVVMQHDGSLSQPDPRIVR
jgi:cytochrome c biogenesis protein ResB